MQAQIGRSPNYATSIPAQPPYKLWNGIQHFIHIGLCIVCVERQPERAQSLIDIKAILASEEEIQNRSKDGTELHDPAQGDYEKWPYRFFVNPATD